MLSLPLATEVISFSKGSAVVEDSGDIFSVSSEAVEAGVDVLRDGEGEIVSANFMSPLMSPLEFATISVVLVSVEVEMSAENNRINKRRHKKLTDSFNYR